MISSEQEAAERLEGTAAADGLASAEEIVLRGRGIVPGKIRGEALVSPETISGWGGIDPATGTIIERRHSLCGVSFADKVLVFPGAKGSSGWSGFFQSTRLLGTAPAAMVFTKMTTKAVLGAVVTRVPTVSELDQDPVQIICTGDLVEVDADSGTVTVLQRGDRQFAV
ncbi:aconitase X swivel domain-containing protein [Arthrobacter sulfonylureivorans]|uniref:aconitase X swivel domain-containing protein n=1 Tax=Arthrobacter sulfonylureivorans TaxID=2486855 RepID=UPI0039E59D05